MHKMLSCSILFVIINFFFLAQAQDCTDNYVDFFSDDPEYNQTCQTPNLDCDALSESTYLFAYEICCQCKQECRGKCVLSSSTTRITPPPPTPTPATSVTAGAIGFDLRKFDLKILLVIFIICTIISFFTDKIDLDTLNEEQNHPDLIATRLRSSERNIARERKVRFPSMCRLRKQLIYTNFFSRKLQENDTVKFFGVLKDKNNGSNINDNNKNDKNKHDIEEDTEINLDIEEDIEEDTEEGIEEDTEEGIEEDIEEATKGVFSFTEKPECSICLETYKAGEIIFWAKNKNCKHLFHRECIAEWLLKHEECPLCRNNLLFD